MPNNLKYGVGELKKRFEMLFHVFGVAGVVGKCFLFKLFGL